MMASPPYSYKFKRLKTLNYDKYIHGENYMNALFTKNSLIPVEIYYRVLKTNSGDLIPVVIDDKEAHKLLANEETKGDVHRFGAKFKTISWKMSIDLSREGRSWNHETQREEFDFYKFQDLRFRHALQEWDIKDDDGDPVPLTDANIADLHTNIAQALVAKYDEKLNFSHDENNKNLTSSTK